MGSSYLVTGARLRCMWGSEPGRLVIPEGCYTADGRPKATETDCKKEINISDFGECKLCEDGKTCKECMELTDKWENTSGSSWKLEKLNEATALTMDSVIFCKKGGMIAPETSGQGDVRKINWGALMARYLVGGLAAAFGNLDYSMFGFDPINLNTGNFIYEKEDLVIHGITTLSFHITYNSMEEYSGGSLGEGWHHNYEIYITDSKDGKLDLHLGDGQVQPYRKTIGNIYTPLLKGFGLIKQEADGYRYAAGEGIEYTFDTLGRVLTKQDRNGNIDSFLYNANGQLSEVRGANGGILYYRYNKEGNLYHVSDHTGREVRLVYKYRVLYQYINASGQTYTYDYNENMRLNSVLTPRGIEGVRNIYDGANRVVKQLMPDGGMVELRYDDGGQCTYAKDQNGYITGYESDEKFRHTRTIYKDGEERFAYNENNQRTLYVDKNGNKTQYSYDDKGNLIKIQDALGNKTEITYNENKKPLKIKSPRGGCITYVYDNKGNIIEKTNPNGNTIYIDYNEKNQAIYIKQPDGSHINIDYDERGNMIKITDEMNNNLVYKYDSLNRITGITDGNGNHTKYYYNEQNDLIKIKNAFDRELIYEYGANGKVTQITDFDGTTQKMWYDSCNRPIRYENQEGNIAEFTRDKLGNLICEKMPNGAETHFVYDRNNKMIAYIDPMGGKTKFAYDACGNCIRIEDAEGHIKKYSYDSLNRVIEETDANNNCIKYSYDEEGHLTSIIDVLGNQRTIEYDKSGRKIREINALGNVANYSYNSLGKISQIDDGMGNVVFYEYYYGGLLKCINYPNGHRINYSYDGNRNVIEKWDEQEYHLYYDYDELNRIVSIRSNEGQKIKYGYDAVGNVTSIIDVEGNITKYTYSPTGKLIVVEDKEGNLTRYSYDKIGDLAAIFRTGNEEEQKMTFEEAINLNKEQHDLHLTLYERDLAGRITTITDSLGFQEKYTYNIIGQMTQKQDKEGYLTFFSYTPNGQIEKINYADGRSAQYTYNPLGNITEVIDWLGTTSIDYDKYGRMLKMTDHRGKSIAYEWGARNEKKAVMYPDGSKVLYDYDNLLRLKRLNNEFGSTEYYYGTTGRLEEKICTSGLETNYQYDKEGRIKELTHQYYGKVLENFQFSYNKFGEKEEIRKYRFGLPEENGIYHFNYDYAHRLSSVEKNGHLLRKYEYDVFHNRTAVTTETDRINYTYNILDQLIHIDGNYIFDYTYDARGNLTEILQNGRKQKKYNFDSAGKMSIVEDTILGTCTYNYNGLGTRVSTNITTPIDTIQSEYYYDITREHHNLIMLEYVDKHQKYFWGNGLEGFEEEHRQSHALLDEMGSPLRFLWSNGNESVHYGYDEFGKDLYDTLGNKQPFGYTGYMMDKISGTYYALAREYIPEHGRFNGQDILKGNAKIPSTLNQYIYCRNSALNYIDFLGTSEAEPKSELPDNWWKDMIEGTDADITLKTYIMTRSDIFPTDNITTNVYIPEGLDSTNPYYHTNSHYGFADIIYDNNHTAEVYELKHESSGGRIDGSMQLQGYIWAIEHHIDSSYWQAKGFVNVTAGDDLSPLINGTTLNSLKYPDKKIFYYTNPSYPGMIFWTYNNKGEKDTVMEADYNKLKEKMRRALEKHNKKAKGNAVGNLIGYSALLGLIALDDLIGIYGDDVAVAALLLGISTNYETIFGTCDSLN